MKVYISNYYRRSAWFVVSLGCAIIVALTILYFCLFPDASSPHFAVWGTMVVTLVVVLDALFTFRRVSGHVEIREAEVTSFSFFKQPHCTVDLKSPVYYVLHQNRVPSGIFLYIILSNEPFSYESGFQAKNGLSLMNYNIQNLVIFPYDEIVKPYLKTEDWTCLNWPGDGAYSASQNRRK